MKMDKNGNSYQIQLTEHKVNQQNNFIAGWYMQDTIICDKIIEYHSTTPNRWQGSFGVHNEIVVDPDRKESIDCYLNDNSQLNQEYTIHLQQCVDAYTKIYSETQNADRWSDIEYKNIQYYPPGGGYKINHFERSSILTSKRFLVFMTYLNDVTDKGETEFKYQNLSIKPEKGLTLIWPVEWTHTHRGIPSSTQEKWIVTGWFSFV